jgi:hypothetical protein
MRTPQHHSTVGGVVVSIVVSGIAVGGIAVSGAVSGVSSPAVSVVVGGVVSGVIGGVIGVVVSGRLSPSGILRKVVGRRGTRCDAAGRFHAGVVGGWPVRVMAALMPAPTRERWLEDVAVSLYDFATEDHHALIRDFLAHAPAVIAAAWLTELPRRALGGGRPPEPPR